MKFRAIGDVTTTTVEMTLYNPDTGAKYESQSGVVSDGVVTLVGSYYIKVKRKGRPDWDPNGDDHQSMQVKFWVAKPTGANKALYMLQGVAFSNREPKEHPGNELGQEDFPAIQIAEEKVPSGGTARVFTITNTRAAGVDPGNGTKKKVSYDYLFLIQETEHGAIGIIDPEWENEPQ